MRLLLAGVHNVYLKMLEGSEGAVDKLKTISDCKVPFGSNLTHTKAVVIGAAEEFRKPRSLWRRAFISCNDSKEMLQLVIIVCRLRVLGND